MNIDYTKDVKVLGKVVSIAQDNVVADAEQVYDYGFVYGDQTGLDQHTINSLLKNSISNGGGSISNDSVWNVINGSNKNVAIWSAIKELQDWRTRIDSSPQDIAWLKTQVNNLLQCCETVNSIIGNMPSQGGVVITCNPNPIQMLVGDADKTLSISSSPALAGSYTVTSNNTSVATVLNVSGVYKVHAVGQGNTTITITWGSQTKDVIVTVDLPTYRCYFDLGYTTSEQPPLYQERSHGSLLSKPTDPTRTGYTFNGWHINTSTGSVWNFNTDTITSNITLVAGWTQDQPEQVTVTFNSDGGSAVASQTINKNAKATKPTDPTKSGYNFVNWFYNGNIFDFNTAVTTNITLTAVWEVSTVYPTGVNIDGPTRVEVGSVGTQFTASIIPSEANTQTGITWSATDGSITQAGIFTAPSTTGNVDIIATTERGPYGTKTVEIYQPSGNVEPTHNELYKVTWNVGNYAMLNATTGNGVRTAPWGESWTASLQANTGYAITSVKVYRSEDDVRGEELVTNTSGTRVVNGIASINIEQMYSDIEIVVNVIVPTPGTYNVDYSGVLNNNCTMFVKSPASILSTPGTINSGVLLNAFIEAHDGYEFSENNPVTVTMGGTDVTSTYCYYIQNGSDYQETGIPGWVVYIPNVTGDIVITASTTVVVAPTVTHTVSWSYAGDGAHASWTNMYPEIASGGSVNDGASWTGKLVPGEGYNAYVRSIRMKDSNDQWQQIYTYGTQGGGYDPLTYVVNVTHVTGDVEIVVETEKIPIYVTYKTNIDNALYINYGSSGSVPSDRRLTFEDFQTGSALVTTNGVNNGAIQEDGDESAIFFTQPGYEISNVSVVWDGEAPSWLIDAGHNPGDSVVSTIYNTYNGSFHVAEGIKSSGTVTITLVQELQA